MARVDVVVIGAGPAGIACTTELTTFNIDHVWLSKPDSYGGFLPQIYNRVSNFDDHTYENGLEVLDHVRTTATLARLDGVEVLDIKYNSNEFLVRTARETISAKCVVLATGTIHRTLPFAPCERLAGKKVFWSATGFGAQFAGRSVAVVGGGDAAFENAIRLSNLGCDVTLLIRGKTRARHSFLDEVAARDNIQVHTATELADVIETESGVLLTTTFGETFEVAALFIRIGVQPVYPGLPEVWTDANGFIKTYRRETSLHGLYAIGDVAAGFRQSTIKRAMEDGVYVANLLAQIFGPDASK